MDDKPSQWMSELTDREQKEVEFCLLYSDAFNHGTDGHTRLNIVAKLARKLHEYEIALDICKKTGGKVFDNEEDNGTDTETPDA